jgi:hypothetical protein
VTGFSRSKAISIRIRSEGSTSKGTSRSHPGRAGSPAAVRLISAAYSPRVVHPLGRLEARSRNRGVSIALNVVQRAGTATADPMAQARLVISTLISKSGPGTP